MELTTASSIVIGVVTVSASIVSATVAVFATWRKMSDRFATYDHCKMVREGCEKERRQRRRGDDQRADTLANDLEEIKHTMQSQYKEMKASNKIQYYMLRSLVAHMPNLDASERAKILNAGNGDGR